MNVAQFKQSPSGRLVKVGRSDAAYYAFVPHPLPPPLELDATLIALLTEAAAGLCALAAATNATANLERINHALTRWEAMQSSRIEGIYTTLANLYEFEVGNWDEELAASRWTADLQHTLNCVLAIEHGLARLPELPVSLRLLREAHGVLMSGQGQGYADPGEFRSSQNWIGGAGSRPSTATYVPPPVHEMHASLDVLEKYIYQPDDANPPLIRIALLHQHFEAIHPFVDGNGRTGRLLITLLLRQWGLLTTPILPLSDYIWRNRDQYYALLLGVSMGGWWHEWVSYVLRGVVEAAQRSVTLIGMLDTVADAEVAAIMDNFVGA